MKDYVNHDYFEDQKSKTFGRRVIDRPKFIRRAR